MNKQIHVKLNEDMHKQIRLNAANEGVSLQDYVISAINFKIKEQLSLYSPRLTIQPANCKFTFIDLFADSNPFLVELL